MTERPLATTGEASGVSRAPWTQRQGWLSQHLGTAIIGGVLGYVFGHWLGNAI